MKLYTILGQTPAIHRKKTSRKVLASRKNGAVKVFHPAHIRALNRSLNMKEIQND